MMCPPRILPWKWSFETDRASRCARGVLVLLMLAGAADGQAGAGASDEPPGAPAAVEPAPPMQPEEAQTAPTPSGEPSGWTGDADIDLLELEVPMVMAATRRTEPIERLPYAYTIITAEDIRRSGARSVPDALRLAAGVDVAELAYGNYAVSPRGFHGLLGRGPLVLVDGRTIYDAIFGGTLWANWPFQLEDIERIEIVRGSGGVTWGVGAYSGVVNIVTKDPKDNPGLTMTAGGGSRGTHKEHVGYCFGDQTFRMRVSGEYEASDGFARGGGLLSGPLDDYYKGGRANLHAIFQPNERDTLTLSGGSAVVDGGAPPTRATGYSYGSPGGNSNFLLANWQRRLAEDRSLRWTLYVNDAYTDGGIPQFDVRYQQYALQFGHTFKPARRHTVTWGVDTRWDVVDASRAWPALLSRDHVQTGVVGAYVADVWKLGERWTADLGLRLDYDSYGGFTPSGRVGLAYSPDQHTVVWGAISHSSALINGAARQLDMPAAAGLVRITANRDSEATTQISYELGVRRQFLDKRLNLSASTFWNEFWDVSALGPRLGPPGLVNIQSDNYGSAGIYGVELEGRFALTNSLTLLGNYTYQQMKWESPLSYFSMDAIEPPGHKAMLGARWNATDDLFFNAHAYFVDETRAPSVNHLGGSRDIPAYVRLDLSAEYQFWNDRAALRVGVRNLLDRNHPEGGSSFLNYAEAPRMIFAELRLHLK